MKVGLMVPQGWKGEYDGWGPATAWARTVELAGQAEALGFESLWAFDHFHTVPEPTDEMTFESFTRADRPGHGHRPRPARSHGRLHRVPEPGPHRQNVVDDRRDLRRSVRARDRRRLERDEWLAYGYGFPTIGERLAALRDHLEVIVRMFGPGSGDVPRRVRQRRRGGQRAEGPPVATDPDHRRRQRPGRHVPDRRPVRRRANLVYVGAARVARARRRGPRALRGRPVATRRPCGSRCTRATTTSGRPGRPDGRPARCAPGPRPRSPGHSFPGPLVADGRGAGPASPRIAGRPDSTMAG